MRAKLWVGVGAFVIAQSGQAAFAKLAASPLPIPGDQMGEAGENERGEGEGEGEGRRQVKRPVKAPLVKNSRRAHAIRQHAGQRGGGEYEGDRKSVV